MHTILLGKKSLRLEAFNQNKELLARATGFVVNEKDGIFLYTCWHVVTGVNFLEPEVSKPPDRRILIAYAQDVQQRQPGVTRLVEQELLKSRFTTRPVARVGCKSHTKGNIET
jgi:hypothetical protein